MDDLYVDEGDKDDSAEKYYTVITEMLTALADFRYSNSFIISQHEIKVILTELQYWHDKTMYYRERSSG